jgi:aminopeptidase N
MRRRLAGHVICALATGVVLSLASTTPTVAAPAHHGQVAEKPRPGAPGVGDRLFPLLGNGGYNVIHYDLGLRYATADPAQPLDGSEVLLARATQTLSRFDLDFSGAEVNGIAVNGRSAKFARQGQELVITPRSPLVDGHLFVVTIKHFRSVPTAPKVDPAFFVTPDGSATAPQPDEAHLVYPCNDHPSDKATFSFEITVPSDRKVVANGDLVAQKASPKNANGATTTFDWNETSPMATYLATIGIGRWTFATSRTPGGITQLVAYDPSLAGQVAARKNAELTAQVTDYWATKFGPYPFTSTGAIIDNVPYVGFSLETQTRPLYGFAPDPETLSHELAHQWFGDSVSVQTWRDIWLNEGFATFAANLWAEHTGGPSTWVAAQQTFARTQATSRFWNQAIADPQRDTMFSQSVYVRGGLTLAALRHRIGDTKFFDLLQQWTAAHRFGNATTAQFIALANQVSGQDLSHFFQVWLYTKARPTSLSAR